VRVLSLFSGVGGIDLGLERAGFTIVAHSEVDPFACQVLEKHWPDVPNLGDITQIDWQAPTMIGGEPTELGSVDVIAGGFP
jgi:DNA (cytosine-5)-methyltransferase 1